MVRHTIRRSAQRALDAQPINGFCVEVGAEMQGSDLSRYFVSHPTPSTWILMDRQRQMNDPVMAGTIRQVLDAVFGAA